MEDNPEQIQSQVTSKAYVDTQVTSEKKKDPVRVAAGKRLAAISKIAKERKKKLNEPKESSGNSVITYVGMAVALVSLVLAFKAHQRETKELEPRYTPKTVEVLGKAYAATQVTRAKLDSLE
jgi:hypothetical protein